jgi:hypothetical protein
MGGKEVFRLTVPFAYAHDSNGVHHFIHDGVAGLIWLSNNSLIAQGGWS